MTDNPSISVVIPAYNEEKYIGKCLASLQKQSFKDFEIIVVDNNCADKTAEIAKSFGARIIKEPIQGIIPARERGFKEAKAEIIARTDADTVVTLNWLESIYEAFQREPELVGISGTYITSNIIFRVWSFILVNILAKLVMGHILLIGPTTAIRKSSWKKIKVHYNDRLYLEDWDLTCHMYQVGKLKYIPQLTIPFADRRFRTISGLYDYFINYPIKYFITIWTHHPFLRRH